MNGTLSVSIQSDDVGQSSFEDSWMSLSPQTTPSKGSLHSKNLKANLMREQTKRDPLFYYEAISVLGVGSMGSVTKVKKRDNVIGGSARASLQKYFQQEKKLNACFDLPFVGPFFQHCLKGKEEALRASVHSASGHSMAEPATSASDRPVPSSPRKEKFYAMKSIHLSRIEDKTFVDELLNEIDILRQLDHPHIVKPIETFNFRSQCFIVMELCTGGDLYSRDPYNEEEAARITRQILSAISYMHDRDILHRDIKFENILFVNNETKSEIKLIDFGLSKVFGGERLSEGVGTVYSMAPEVIRGSYSKQADLWSIGCICYMLLSSQMPFYGRTRKQIIEQIMAAHVEFKGRRWKKITPSAKEFVRSLLVLDDQDRATADEAFASPWLNRRHSVTVRNPHAHEVDGVVSNIAKYAKYERLKKVALMVIAHKSTSEEIGILRKVFEQYDVKRKGSLTYHEFKAAFLAAGYLEEDCRRIFEATDIDGSGKIRYTEFLAATIEAHGAISEERLAEAFDRLDCDDSGYISVQNLRDILGNDVPAAELEAIIKEADLTMDNQISYPEFLALWQEKHECLRDDIMKGAIPGSSSNSSSSSPGNHEDDIVSKANFVKEKLAMQRKGKDLAMPPEHVHGIAASSRSVMSGMTVNSFDHVRVADV